MAGEGEFSAPSMEGESSGLWTGQTPPIPEVTQAQWDEFLAVVSDEDKARLVGASHLPRALARDLDLKAQFLEYIATSHSRDEMVFPLVRVLTCSGLMFISLGFGVLGMVLAMPALVSVFSLAFTGLSGLALYDVVRKVSNGEARIEV